MNARRDSDPQSQAEYTQQVNTATITSVFTASVNPNPQTTKNATFCLAFHIFVVGELRDFKFSVLVDHSTYQPTDNKLYRKGAWSRHVTHFNFQSHYT